MLPFLFLATASAHKIHVFATANGATIEGKVHAAGDSPVRSATVTVLGPNGEKLGQTTTDDDGKFHFAAQQHVEHTFVVDTGDGHTATYKVPADELPHHLPEKLPASEKPSVVVPSASTHDHDHDHPDHVHSAAHEQANVMKELKAIRAQVIQVRKQLDAYQQQVRLHDILGGIGVIFGFVGVSSYFLAARRRSVPPAGQN